MRVGGAEANPKKFQFTGCVSGSMLVAARVKTKVTV